MWGGGMYWGAGSLHLVKVQGGLALGEKQGDGLWKRARGGLALSVHMCWPGEVWAGEGACKGWLGSNDLATSILSQEGNGELVKICGKSGHYRWWGGVPCVLHLWLTLKDIFVTKLLGN